MSGTPRRPYRILSVVGTRPNFMKMAPIIAELRRRPETFQSLLVHTGQHYDRAMSDVFLDELGIPAPDFSLDVGSGTHARQTGRVMERLEDVISCSEPDLMLVPGDVNSTLAAALVAAKLQIPIGHVEAGLRSFDRSMPEEINRVLTDQLADLLFTHSPEADGHLRREGVPAERIHAVGNTMIDTLVALRPRIEAAGSPERFGLTPGAYAVVTLHRPALVDGPALLDTVRALDRLADALPVVFPVHPRTRQAMETQGLCPASGRLHLLDPLPYIEFMSLVSRSAAVVTDSGGIQEETTYLGIPCFTLRDNTERPVTVEVGSNTLLGLAPHRIAEIPLLLERAARGGRRVPHLWDGHASSRLVDVLAESPLLSGATRPALAAA